MDSPFVWIHYKCSDELVDYNRMNSMGFSMVRGDLGKAVGQSDGQQHRNDSRNWGTGDDSGETGTNV